MSIRALSSLRSPLRFRAWVELEEHKAKVIRAAAEGSAEFPKTLTGFLSAALGIPERVIGHLPWWDCARILIRVAEKNAPRIALPLIVQSPQGKLKPEAWDYDGRTWHMYAHLLAEAYGWDLEYIARLKVDDALAQVQEVFTDEQLRKEFEWAMSEVAYSYDSRSKTTKFVSLERPFWMRPRIEKVKKIKIPKALVPVGNVDYRAIGPENAPKDLVA